MDRVGWVSLLLVVSLGGWVGQVQGQPSWGDEKVLIKIRAQAVTEIEAICSVSSPYEQGSLELGTHTGLKEFDEIGERYGLLWIEQTYGDAHFPQQFYGLHFPLGSSVEEIMVAYARLPFIEYAEPGRGPADEIVLINLRPEAVAEMEAIWSVSWVGCEAAEAWHAGRFRTGLDVPDAIGEQYGLLWIQRSYESWDHELARRIYALHFPGGSPKEAIEGAYREVSFIQAVAVGAIPSEWLVEDPGNGWFNEKVIIKIRAEAGAEIEAIWAISVNLTGDKARDLQNITQAKERRTGLLEFDGIGEQYGLLWIEQSYSNRQVYGLHFPLGSPMEEIMAAYARLPFIEYAEPGRLPVVLADGTAINRITWGQIKTLLK